MKKNNYKVYKSHDSCCGSTEELSNLKKRGGIASGANLGPYWLELPAASTLAKYFFLDLDINDFTEARSPWLLEHFFDNLFQMELM